MKSDKPNQTKPNIGLMFQLNKMDIVYYNLLMLFLIAVIVKKENPTIIILIIKLNCTNDHSPEVFVHSGNEFDVAGENLIITSLLT